MEGEGGYKEGKEGNEVVWEGQTDRHRESVCDREGSEGGKHRATGRQRERERVREKVSK